MKDIQTIPSAEPFFLPGNRTGVVLIHGFTGSPKEMRLMGEALNQRGLTVLGIRLAGHATQPDDLIRTRWWDWLASVEDGINLLSKSCDRIFYAGLSLGGVLALTAASHIPPTGVIAMSAPYSVDSRIKYLRIIGFFVPRIKKEAPQEKDEEIRHQHVDYPYYPTRSLLELQNAIIAMRHSIDKISAPVLLINSKSDPVVPIAHADKIKALLTTANVEQVVLENSGHVITEDIEREIVFESAFQFIQKNSKTS
jgi:carboxylesterase